MEATGGLEPPYEDLQSSALPLGHVATSENSDLRHGSREEQRNKLKVNQHFCWCRGRDSNPHARTDTTPSTLPVYQFQHLGTVFNCRRRILPQDAFACWIVAGAEGLEPPTAGFGDRCSTKLSYAPSSTGVSEPFTAWTTCGCTHCEVEFYRGMPTQTNR